MCVKLFNAYIYIYVCIYIYQRESIYIYNITCVGDVFLLIIKDSSFKKYIF